MKRRAGRRLLFAASRWSRPINIGFLTLKTCLNKKTPPLAAKRNGGAGTEKRPYAFDNNKFSQRCL